MNETTVIELIYGMGRTVLLLAGPLLMIGLAAGLLISIIQVVTSIQDPTLSFVPRIVVVMLAGLLLVGWMMERMITYTTELYSQLPLFAQ